MKRGLRASSCQRRSDLADNRLQHRLADELVAPHLIEQGVLGQQCPRLSHERAEHRKRRGRDRDSLTIAQQARIRLVQVKPVESRPNRI